MPDNLAVNIELRTKNLDELSQINAQLRNLRKEAKAVADQAIVDPSAVTKLHAVNQEISKLEQSSVKLNHTLRATKQAAGEAGESLAHMTHAGAIGRLVREFSSLGKAGEAAGLVIGRLTGGFAGGVFGYAAARVFSALVENIDNVSKALDELKKKSAEIGVRPIALQASREIAAEAGQDAEAATKIMEGYGKIIDENRKKMTAPTSDRPGFPTVLSGGTLGTGTPGSVAFPGAAGAGGAGGLVSVGRGGAAPITALDKAVAALNVDMSRFPATELGVEQRMLTLQRIVDNLHKTMTQQDFNIFAKEKFGVSGEELFKDTELQIAKTEARIKSLQGQLHGATQEHLDDNQKLLASEGKLHTVVAEFWAMQGQTAAREWTAINEYLADLLETYLKFGKDLQSGWENNAAAFKVAFIDPVTASFSEMLPGMESGWEAFSTSIVRIAGAAADQISAIWNWIKSATSAAGTAIGDAASQGAIPGRFASGGYVRGPGSGTSDSILARLSAGEFVINSASVRRLGAGFLSGLNGFAGGGLVGAIPSFAAGGMVTGGRAVHLHLGSGNFALSGSGSVVDALVSAAHSQQVRSAGVKPSWFAARPSGQ